ncbi:DNA-processing protein DprA [Ottowia thiooxydans]|uniref:DNA-processing protein DprA n=1 Tax=Ottowia thiooxydans TaxID=219182 RepID=UPI000400BFCB|nr:DNA-processing protein DprA [Ottowia thiooxydans]
MMDMHPVQSPQAAPDAALHDWHLLFNRKPVDAHLELGAYEHLWLQERSTVKRLAELFSLNPEALPSDLVDMGVATETAKRVLQLFMSKGLDHFGVRVNGADEYPESLRDAVEPVEMLYYQGDWDLVESPKRVAVVGTRKVSPEGAARTRKLVRALVQHDYTIVSGLAKGVDTVAHTTAIASGGRTIAVIGTPLSEFYPRENEELQRKIATEHLLISQVPVLKYMQQDHRMNRFFFPERNKTMSALTNATIIVEASETSGTLIQAQAAIKQKRRLFILESNFHNPDITWPAKFEKLGAVRVRDFDDVLMNLH